MQLEECPPGYICLNKLGEGAHGAVYMVVKTGHSLARALKRYSTFKLNRDPKLAEKIEDEIKTMQKVDNEHVLKIYEVIKSPKYTNLILDFCDGGDFTAVLKKRGSSLPEDELKPIFFDLLKGFQALRALSIIHRDIKPENLLMKNGKVVIGDFGVCKFGVAKTGTVVGNYCTIAPEIRQVQMGDQDKYDFKVDVWSLGVTLYMLLVGRDPWNFNDVKTGRQPINTTKLDYTMHSGNNLPFPADIPLSESLKGILRRMISLKPEDRPDWTMLQQAQYFDSLRQFAPIAQINHRAGYQTVALRPDYPVGGGAPANPISRAGFGPAYGGISESIGYSAYVPAESKPTPVHVPNIFATRQIESGFDIPAEVTKDTAFEYFRHNKQVASYLSDTANILQQPKTIKDPKIRSLLLGCGACGQVIGIQVIQASLQHLESRKQPEGIQTMFGGAGQFYDSVLAQGVQEELMPEYEKATNNLLAINGKLSDPQYTLPEKQTIATYIEHCFESSDLGDNVKFTCKRVAHVLSQEIKKHQQDQTQYNEMKALLVRIYLCLTYQQAMEFRDREKNAFDWNSFNDDLKGGFLTHFYWKNAEEYFSSPN